MSTAVATATAKDRMIETLREQPDDSSYDELLHELAFERMIELGLEDHDQGHVISDEDLRSEIATWGK